MVLGNQELERLRKIHLSRCPTPGSTASIHYFEVVVVTFLHLDSVRIGGISHWNKVNVRYNKLPIFQ